MSTDDDYYLVRTDSSGDTLWTSTYGGLDMDRAKSVCLPKEGGYVIAGYSYSFGNNTAYVVRLASDSPQFIPSRKSNGFREVFSLGPAYPNTFNASTIIPYELTLPGRIQVSIYNLLGQKIATLIDREVAAGSYSAIWNAGDLPSGIYICQIETSGITQTLKLILLK